jgi:hypothetical protein
MNKEKQEENNCNISFFLEDDSTIEKDNNFIFEELEIEESNNPFELDLTIFSSYEKLTCKELSLICDYYGIANSKKCKKEQIIYLIVNFESNPNNLNTVYQRKNMWFYMNELKNDKNMKKYVLW